MTKNVEIYYFIQTETEEREYNGGDVGSKEMEYVDRTGTYILKPTIIIHQICVEVKCYYSVQYIFMWCYFCMYIYLWTEMQEVQGQEGSGDEDSGPMNLEERTGTSL